MPKNTILPFGPQHPVLPEPLHFDLVLEDEKIVDVIPSIGYIHRGLEKLVSDKDFIDYVFVAERVCGICSFIHGMGYVQAVETLMNLEIPERAKFLRSFWSELSRVHSHLLWMGLFADALGYESLFMHSWRVRELILDIFEETTGGRIIFGVCKVGGVRKDIDKDTFGRIKNVLKDIIKEVQKVTNVFMNDYSLQKRLSGVGYLSKEDAYRLGAVGPMARASGLTYDMRKLGYAAYDRLDFEVAVDNRCDSMGRVAVRVKEIMQAFYLMYQIIETIPEGPVDIKVLGTPDGEYFSRLEQPRGEVIYYVKGNGTRYLERFRLRTPTFANIPSMIHILKNAELADVPVITHTIDPCISCAER